MVTHHPSSNMLLEHAAGTSSWAVSLSISAHLQMCPQCRHQVNHLNHVGGALLASSAPEAPPPALFQQLMQHIEFEQSSEHDLWEDNPPDENEFVPPPGSSHRTDLLLSAPKAVRKLMRSTRQLQWSTLTSSLKTAPLAKDLDQEIRLCRLIGGGVAPARQPGDPWISLVLRGYASNNEGLYAPGDFIVYDSSNARRLVATQNEDCLYLSVVHKDAVKHSGLVMNTFHSVKGKLGQWAAH